MEQLSVQQAKELGYEYFLYENIVGWQHLKEIRLINNEDIKRGCTLASIEEYQPIIPSEEDILEMIADQITTEYYDQTQCDDMYDLEDAVKSLKLGKGFIEKIAKAVAPYAYRKDTGIKIALADQ